MPLDEDVSLKKLARAWDKLNGAEIESICTEAGMNAIRARRKIVVHSDFITAYNKFVKKGRETAPAAPIFS